jgi:hypothetical protein
MTKSPDLNAIRTGIAVIPGDVSSDAHGQYVAKVDDIYAPEMHAAALDPATPIVIGSRGTGKSFWAGVLGQDETRQELHKAYPKLALGKVQVAFGYTGVSGPEGVNAEHIDKSVPKNADLNIAMAFWWATVLRAVSSIGGSVPKRPAEFFEKSQNLESREKILSNGDQKLLASGRTLLIVYDALDTVAISWARRRLLTEALLRVVWAMRAYRSIRLKLFLRPDQIDDDQLRFVELPKLRTGAVRLEWTGSDLYGLLYARLALSTEDDVKVAFAKLVAKLGIERGTRDAILARRWILSHDKNEQARVMDVLSGPYMATGTFGYKKGKTYDWPVTHLADALSEVTPRSFIGLMIAAAKYGAPPGDRVITPEGIRHGLRAASKTRVDQLHQDFPWIKGVLAPLAGLLLPQVEDEVIRVWQNGKTVQRLIEDAKTHKYLPPFPKEGQNKESDLLDVLEKLGVIFRRKDGRIDMPDLFRVAAKLLKKGGTAPV